MKDTESHFKQKWAWPYISQRIEVLEYPMLFLGVKLLELPSAKLSAHKSYYRVQWVPPQKFAMPRALNSILVQSEQLNVVEVKLFGRDNHTLV